MQRNVRGGPWAPALPAGRPSKASSSGGNALLQINGTQYTGMRWQAALCAHSATPLSRQTKQLRQRNAQRHYQHSNKTRNISTVRSGLGSQGQEKRTG